MARTEAALEIERLESDAVDALIARLPAGTHALVLLKTPEGVGLSSCCDPASDNVQRMLARAALIVEQTREDSDGDIVPCEVDAHGTH